MLASRSSLLMMGVGLLAAVPAASCGGSTKTDTGAAGSYGWAGAGGGTGGSGTGGGSGGTSGGGTGGGGTGATGGSGVGGSGGLPARCALPPETGDCEAAFIRYFHDPRTGVCEPFTYGGCGGNDNNFSTRAACEAACRGGAVEMNACETTSDCTVASVGCCGGCETLNEGILAAVNGRHLDEYGRVKGCTGIACGPCPEVDELETSAQYYVAVCEAGACTIADIRKTPVTECSSDSECTLRDSAGCCDGCDGRGLVAVRADRNRALMCEGNEGCPPCVGIAPPEFTPRCLEGRCTVTRVRP
jgi:hypothetical protein